MTSIATPTKPEQSKLSTLISWLFAVLLSYPLALLLHMGWDVLMADGELFYNALHDFLYPFLHGSKRHFLHNLTGLLIAWSSGCLFVVILSLLLMALRQLIAGNEFSRWFLPALILGFSGIAFSVALPGIFTSLMALTILINTVIFRWWKS